MSLSLKCHTITNLKKKNNATLLQLLLKAMCTHLHSECIATLQLCLFCREPNLALATSSCKVWLVSYVTISFFFHIHVILIGISLEAKSSSIFATVLHAHTSKLACFERCPCLKLKQARKDSPPPSSTSAPIYLHTHAPDLPSYVDPSVDVIPHTSEWCTNLLMP